MLSKSIAIFIASLLFGCAAINNPDAAIQSVRYKSGADGVLIATCSGAVEDWGSCQSKARKSCVNGYEIMDKLESPVGGKRELTFKCK